MNQHITDAIILRDLQNHDTAALASYFAGLGTESKQRFGPHPLTEAGAAAVCSGQGTGQKTVRLVLETHVQIIGYFILEPQMSEHEARRYLVFDIALESDRDYLFAPSISDQYQNQGLASLAMPDIIAEAKALGARSLVLMGGTQASNGRAIAFYEKFGFERFGGYQTEVFNHDMRLVFEDKAPA
jgi:diamine N-acetyltransferase